MTEQYKYTEEGYLNENFRLFHLKDTAGQERDFHYHSFDKIVLLISGSVNYLVEGKEYALKPWDILLVRHHMIHKAQIDKSLPYERIIIYLNSAYVDRYAPNGGLMHCFSYAEKSRYSLIRPTEEGRELLKDSIKRLEESVSDTDFASDIMRGTMLTQLMVLINRFQNKESGEAETETECNEKISNALSYINQNLRARLSVDELAAMSFLSRYHFMRLFKAQTGCSVHSYIRQKRLILAARLIKDGLSASSAATECGYTDYSAFHRAFTQTFGVSPGKYKDINM